MTAVLVVLWEWGPKSQHAGNRFHACHSITNDGRLRDWPEQHDLIPLGAAVCRVDEGAGLELLAVLAPAREKGSKVND
jgi:hypothetical protein